MKWDPIYDTKKLQQLQIWIHMDPADRNHEGNDKRRRRHESRHAEERHEEDEEKRNARSVRTMRGKPTCSVTGTVKTNALARQVKSV